MRAARGLTRPLGVKYSVCGADDDCGVVYGVSLRRFVRTSARNRKIRVGHMSICSHCRTTPFRANGCRARRLIAALMACLALAISLAPLRAAAGPDDPATAPDQAQIAAELQSALRATEAARTQANSAKRDFDDFVTQHFEAHRARAAAPAPDLSTIDAQSQPSRPSKPAVNPEWQRLHDQLEELTAARDQLLDRFTSAHPEVVDIEGRITAVSQQLADFGSPSRGQALEGPARAVTSDGRLAERLRADYMEHQEVAGRYDQLLARWQAAEQNLRTAVANENVVAERLAALRPSETEPVGTEPQTAPSTVASATPTETVPVAAPAPTFLTSDHSSNDSPRPKLVAQDHGSQPLALAALLIALAVAALAAVRLCAQRLSVCDHRRRGSRPGRAGRGGDPGCRRDRARAHGTWVAARGVKFGIELVFAFFVFAVVAYCVQNVAYLIQFCSHPLDAIEGAGFFGR